MTKRIKRQFWLTEEENRELKRKAKLSGLSDTAVIRILLKGYEPRENPDDRFYEVIRELSAIGNNLNQLTAKAHALGFIEADKLHEEMIAWGRFELAVEQEFLLPTKSKLKWE